MPAPTPPARPSIAESPAQTQWQAGHAEEIAFWDGWLAGRGQPWPEAFADRLNPERPLQPYLRALLPAGKPRVRILDVGAGPLTYVGFVAPPVEVIVTAVDPLAHEYDRLLARHAITPILHTQPGDAERLEAQFGPDSFDLVTARNCIDHSYDPLAAIEAMLAVVRPGCWVLLQHAVAEAETQHYAGLHQWNLLDEAGDLVLAGRSARVNVTERLRRTAAIRNEIQYDGTWLVTWMRKRPPGPFNGLRALRPHRPAGRTVITDPARWLPQ